MHYLGAHANTQEHTADEQLVPVLCARGANDGEKTEDSGEEDCSTTTKVVVERV